MFSIPGWNPCTLRWRWKLLATLYSSIVRIQTMDPALYITQNTTITFVSLPSAAFERKAMNVEEATVNYSELQQILRRSVNVPFWVKIILKLKIRAENIVFNCNKVLIVVFLFYISEPTLRSQLLLTFWTLCWGQDIDTQVKSRSNIV